MSLSEDAARMVRDRRERQGVGGVVLAVAALAAAVVAASCCVVPFVLVTLGIGGAWIASLTALGPFQPLALGVSAAALAGALIGVYRRPKAACGTSRCAATPASRFARTGLWLAAAVAALAFAWPLLARFFIEA
jgi:mercuric ion transport protein